MRTAASRIVTVATRPDVVISLLVGLAVLIPYIARVISPDSSIHPASVLVFVVVVLLAVFRSRATLDEFLGRWPLYALSALIAVVAFITTAAMKGDEGKAYIVNHIVVPVALFAVMQVLLHGRERYIAGIGKALVWIGVAETLFGALQILVQRSIIFETQYRQYTWFNTMMSENRALGSLDHSLVLALFLVIAICFTQTFRRVWLRVATAVVLLTGVFLTQSRIGLVLALVILFVLILQDRQFVRFRGRILLGSGAVLVAIMLTPVGQSVVARFANDQGSNARRFQSIDAWLSVWTDHILGGTGIGSSFVFTTARGLRSSFENPVLILAFDIGLVWAVLWFALQLALALGFSLRVARRDPVPTTADGEPARRRFWGVARFSCAAIAPLVFIQSFSSTATQSAASMLVWFALGLLVASRRAGPAELETATRPATRSAAHRGDSGE
jgi:hypothetical protein